MQYLIYLTQYYGTGDFWLALTGYLSEIPSNIRTSDVLHKNAGKKLKIFQCH